MNRVSSILARTVIFTRKPIEKISPNGIMKLRYTALAAVVASSSAWLPPPNLARPRAVRHAPSSKTGVRSMGDFVLQSTVAPEEVERTYALTPTGNPIAEGNVVSAFRGGLVAVKVDEEDINLSSATSPEVVDMTNSLPKAEKSKSLGGCFIPCATFRVLAKSHKRSSYIS